MINGRIVSGWNGVVKTKVSIVDFDFGMICRSERARCLAVRMLCLDLMRSTTALRF